VYIVRVNIEIVNPWSSG